jgi:hypothetical protein
MDNGVAFEMMRDAIDDPAFLKRVRTNLDQVLTEHGFSKEGDRREMKRLMDALTASVEQQEFLANQIEYRAMLDRQLKTTFETADAFKTGLKKTVEQIEQGFKSTMRMYEVAFYLGAGVIAAAIVMAFVSKTALLPIVFGSLGVADILAYFITKPPQDLQFSRARLAQLQAAFFNWFVDYTNWNGILQKLINERGVKVEDLKEVSGILMSNTEKTMQLIDTYCAQAQRSEKGRGDR